MKSVVYGNFDLSDSLLLAGVVITILAVYLLTNIGFALLTCGIILIISSIISSVLGQPQ